MTIRVLPEAGIVKEAGKILLQHMTPSKAPRFWASWHQGNDTFFAWRDETFHGETVDSLYEKIVAFQTEQDDSSA